MHFTIFIVIGVVLLHRAVSLATDNEIDFLPNNNIKAELLWQLILPGTKWCGDGDIAEDYDDLGRFVETDICCRAHDHCEDYIVAHSSKYGLSNDGKYTRLHCDCDIEFYQCLKSTNIFISNLVGTMYFNTLGGQCFNYTPPATCIKYTKIERKPRCIEYAYEDGEKSWQWFDVPKYS